MKFIIGIFILFISPCTFSGLYSLKTKDSVEWEELLKKNSIVVVMAKNCKACLRLQSELEQCQLPQHYVYKALVTDDERHLKNVKNQFFVYKTSQKWIEKQTSVTPVTYVDGKRFKEGYFHCSELQKIL